MNRIEHQLVLTMVSIALGMSLGHCSRLNRMDARVAVVEAELHAPDLKLPEEVAK